MRVLFTTQPGQGHLQPMAPYAQALARAGHEVRVATAPGFAPAVRALGLVAEPVGLDFTWENPTECFPHLVEARREGKIGEALLEIVWDRWVPAALSDLERLTTAWTPDLIVREALDSRPSSSLGEREFRSPRRRGERCRATRRGNLTLFPSDASSTRSTASQSSWG